MGDGAMRMDCLAVLDFLFEMAVVFSRRDCGFILAGVRPVPSELNTGRLMRQWERQGLIERATEGTEPKFRLSVEAERRLAQRVPSGHWDRPWEGKWWIVSYDLPEAQRPQRAVLWRALRERKLGLLQRSVWVWPHPVEPILRELVQSEGMPECFIGFEAQRVCWCTNAEVVRTAWDQEEIGRRHRAYLQHAATEAKRYLEAPTPAALAALARREWEAYHYAFSLDPLLPRALAAKAYRGYEVEARHRQCRNAWRQRLAALTRRVR